MLRDVALEVKLRSLGDEALAALLAAAFDAIAASLRGHAGTESVLLFAGTFGWLVCAEAHGGICGESCVPVGARGRDFRKRRSLVNAQVNRAPAGRRRTYRAHGRIGKYASQPAHIEIILKEEGSGVEKMDDDTRVKITKKQAAKKRFVKVGSS